MSNNTYEYKLYISRHSVITSNIQVAKKEFNYDLNEGEFIKVLYNPGGNQYSNSEEVAKIQNIFWLYGMAPRIKKIVYVNFKGNRYKAYIVELLHKIRRGDCILRIKELKQICRDNFIDWNNQGHDQELHDTNNWIKDKFVDFGGFKFNDKKAYLNKLNAKIEKQTHFGKRYKGESRRYQSDDKFDGKRKTAYRIEKLGLESIDFKGKSVLDIGCNLGMFCQYAKQRGASVVYGYDVSEDMIRCAKEYANWKGIYDIEFIVTDIDWDLKHGRQRMPNADIVFYLAMSEYLSFDKRILGLANEVLIYEGHSNEDSENTKNKLKEVFPRVEDLGFTDDRSIRPIFKCYKE